jgi:hypothetical protein
MDHGIQRALVERDVYTGSGDGRHGAHVADLPFYLWLIRVSGSHKVDYDGGEVDAELGCVAKGEEVVWYCLNMGLVII